MAGIFGLFDYTKEGPGVDPDEPQKGPVLEFFTLYFRKFWKFLTMSFMFLIGNLPGIALGFVFALYYMPLLFPIFAPSTFERLFEAQGIDFGDTITVAGAAAQSSFIFVVVMALTLVAMQFFVVGPVQAGLTYIHRNYARGEHAFLWWDFRDAFKDNWKQSLVTSLLSTLVCFLILNAYYFYGQAVEGVFSTVLRTLLMVLLFLLTSMLMYAYQMMVTFDLPLKHIFKNSLLFTILRLPFNFGIILLLLVINVVVPVLIATFLVVELAVLVIAAYFILFSFSFSLFLINYFVNRQLVRYMIEPLMAAEAAEAEAEEENWDDEYEYEEDPEAEEDAEEDEDEELSDSRSYPKHAPV